MYVFFLDAVVTNLILSRTCEIELKFNESFCNALGTNTEEGHKAEALVQPHASVLLMGKTLIGAIFPAIMSLFLGPWSDLNGRRLLLIVPLSGKYQEKKIISCFRVMSIKNIYFQDM